MNSKNQQAWWVAVMTALLPACASETTAEPSQPPLAVAPFDAAEAKRHQQAWAEYLGVPVEITNGIGMRLVLIPPGEFLMGSAENDSSGFRDERPQLPVRISRPFYLGKYPVTQTQWESLMGSNPSFFSSVGGGSGEVSGRSTADLPIESISWNDAQQFIQKLNDRLGETRGVYRLPTEAEWEYACRAGTNTRYYFGNDQSQLEDYAVYHSNSGAIWQPPRTRVSPPKSWDVWGFPQDNRSDIVRLLEQAQEEYRARMSAQLGGVWLDTPSEPEKGRYIGGSTQSVGLKPPNAWDLHDMHGNVWEWCSDWFRADYYANAPINDPPGPETGSHRLIRGGSWRNESSSLRSANRLNQRPDSTSESIGFRLAKSVVPPGDFAADPSRPPLAVAPFDAATARLHQEAWAKHLGVEVEIENSIGMKLTLIPPGEFMMGSSVSAAVIHRLFPGGLVEWYQGEHPCHKVRIARAYYLGTHEVTVGDFDHFVSATDYKTTAEKERYAVGYRDGRWRELAGLNWRNPGFHQTSTHPVTCISWDDAVAFCQWLSREEGRTYRLPTEAEWEYACRAGTETLFFWGDDPDAGEGYLNGADKTGAPDGRQWMHPFNFRDGYAATTPMGRFKPNAFGLHDMLGNVWEWCSDLYGGYTSNPVDDPPGARAGSLRVYRGGSWIGTAKSCRSADRGRNQPSFRSYDLGFRVALSSVGPSGQ